MNNRLPRRASTMQLVHGFSSHAMQVKGVHAMRNQSEKSVLDRLLGDWWVDAGVALFVIVMLTITHLK